MTDLPELYFRIRENGAVVFRVDTENRMRRIDMDQIAVVNVKNGEIKPHGGRELAEAERTKIEGWMEMRRNALRTREIDEIERTIERLNLTAAWAQQSATPEELETVSDRLLFAMHDLRSVLVRKKSQAARASDDDIV